MHDGAAFQAYGMIIQSSPDANPISFTSILGYYTNPIYKLKPCGPLSPAEKKRREIRLRQGAWDRVLMDIGFTTLFKAISDACNGLTFTKERTTGFMNGQFTELSIPSNNNEETGKKIPLIIHNGLQDLMFLLTHCHDATLPESFEDTKKIIRSYFPLIYDTKVLATEYSDAIITSGSTGLEDLYKKTCTEDESDSDMSLLKVPPIKNQDGGSQGQAHEAAWDAFMTGMYGR